MKECSPRKTVGDLGFPYIFITAEDDKEMFQIIFNLSQKKQVTCQCNNTKYHCAPAVWSNYHVIS